MSDIKEWWLEELDKMSLTPMDTRITITADMKRALFIAIKQNSIMKLALNKLSCLGNGDCRGNSKGNDIAIDAFKEMGYD